MYLGLADGYRLEDPFIGFNEIKAEWVGKAAWSYKVDFINPRIPPGCVAELVFEGLDTFANVKLDGLTILEADNMFLPYRVDVTKAVSRSEQHTLEIDFESAFLKGDEIKSEHPEHRWEGFNGDMGRLAVRKAQCHWGWDWGPILNCAGIWRPVRLEVFQSRIAEVRTEIELQSDHKSATVMVTVQIDQNGGKAQEAHVRIIRDQQVVDSADIFLDQDGQGCATLIIHDPSLWMPNGYGNQTLYAVDVSLVAHGRTIDTVVKRIGIRQVELVQQPDKHGKSFFFRINGVDIFCGGSCWIPADSFLTNISAQRYRAWLELMVPANQKMIRYVARLSYIQISD